MNNNRYYLVIVFFFLAAGAAFYLNVSTEKKLKEVEQKLKPKNNDTVKLSDKPGVTTKLSGSVFDLVKLNIPMRCVYEERVSDDVTISGTMYTDGTNSRSNSRLKTLEKETQTNTIYTGDMVYIWASGDTQGVQMDMKRYIEKMPKDLETSGSKVPADLAKLDEKLNFECIKWDIDKNMFSIPTTFKFVDITEALFKIQEDPCLICDTIEPSRKAQCIKALKCN